MFNMKYEHICRSNLKTPKNKIIDLNVIIFIQIYHIALHHEAKSNNSTTVQAKPR